MGSQLESSDKADPADLKALADNWRILEMVEVEAGVEAGIARRSATKQGASRVLSIETNLAKAHFARSLEAKDIDGLFERLCPPCPF